MRSFAEPLVDLEMLDDGHQAARRERAAMAGVIAARNRALARMKREVLRPAARR